METKHQKDMLEMSYVYTCLNHVRLCNIWLNVHAVEQDQKINPEYGESKKTCFHSWKWLEMKRNISLPQRSYQSDVSTEETYHICL